jgi:hypothetical protein
MCQKKYCECFNAGLACDRCVDAKSALTMMAVAVAIIVMIA